MRKLVETTFVNIHLKLIGTTSFSSGIVVLTYARARPRKEARTLK